MSFHLSTNKPTFLDVFPIDFNAIQLCVGLRCRRSFTRGLWPSRAVGHMLYNLNEHWLQGPRLAALWIGVLDSYTNRKAVNVSLYIACHIDDSHSYKDW